MERLVRSLGFAVETYLSSVDFVEQMESLPSFCPDCVILDIQMPGLNGLEVQRRLRWIYKDVPVIFITAYDDLADRDKALAAGAVAVLRKPCNDVLLMRSLRTALRRRGPREPPPSDPAAGGSLAQSPIVPPEPE